MPYTPSGFGSECWISIFSHFLNFNSAVFCLRQLRITSSWSSEAYNMAWQIIIADELVSSKNMCEFSKRVHEGQPWQME